MVPPGLGLREVGVGDFSEEISLVNLCKIQSSIAFFSGQRESLFKIEDTA
jgi:hypothetical protein